MERIPVVDKNVLRGVIITFIVATSPNKDNEARIQFCGELVKAFMSIGVRFEYTFDIDNPKINFNSIPGDSDPRITIYYEANRDVFCTWPFAGDLKKKYFSHREVRLFRGTTSRTIKEWKKAN